MNILDRFDMLDFSVILDKHSITSGSSICELNNKESVEDLLSVEIPLPEGKKESLYRLGLYDPGSGEICTKYLPLTDSSLLGHSLYKIDLSGDVGIEDALMQPYPGKQYEGNAEYYLEKCEELGTNPISSFIKSLTKRDVDLKYYGVSSKGVHAICLTLELNSAVIRLDLSDNFLDANACFFLGELLTQNEYLQEIILEQCKMYSEGLATVIFNIWRRDHLDLLNVSSNEISDKGLQLLLEQFEKGAIIKKLYLSRNNLGERSALRLSKCLNSHRNMLTHLDISWNSLGVNQSYASGLLRALANCTELEELNLSFNYIESIEELQALICAPKLLILDLRNNQLRIPSFIADGVRYATGLKTLKLSHNPLSSSDALQILEALESNKSSVQHLELLEIDVEPLFIETLERIKTKKPAVTVSHGRVRNNDVIKKSNMEEIVLRRLHYLTSLLATPKYKFCVYFLKLKQRGKKYIKAKTVLKYYETAKVQHIHAVDQDLVDELANTFPKEKGSQNSNEIDIDAVCDYIKRLYPKAWAKRMKTT